jgi:hypothetical protein
MNFYLFIKVLFWNVWRELNRNIVNVYCFYCRISGLLYIFSNIKTLCEAFEKSVPAQILLIIGFALLGIDRILHFSKRNNFPLTAPVPFILFLFPINASYFVFINNIINQSFGIRIFWYKDFPLYWRFKLFCHLFV